MVSTKSVYEPNEVIGLNTILKAHETVVSTKIGYDPENVKELGTTNMAEQTEKAFLKQPKVFLCSKKSGKGKRPGKGGNRYWKSIGLGFKTPREAIEACKFWHKLSISFLVRSFNQSSISDVLSRN
ncbi:unnamed protein product [Ilex paraguariensis]|uniref:Small ribosomal subunit protein uS17 N-terminal domain-containing protein n=1 Tax=Ilex paraguariensis TaxID=185542 RepID=A0ABC8V1I5_9AQUA